MRKKFLDKDTDYKLNYDFNLVYLIKITYSKSYSFLKAQKMDGSDIFESVKKEIWSFKSIYTQAK